MIIDAIFVFPGIGFFILLIGDLLQLRKRSRDVFAVVIVGYIVIFFSLVFIVITAGTPTVSPFGFGLAAIAAAPAAFLLWKSLFTEVAQSGASSGNRYAVSKGTYSICRHPGFLWLTWLLVVLVLVYRTPTVTMAAAWMTAMNLALVAIEDVFIFPRIFVNYDEYKKRVAFLLPFGKGA